MIIFVKIAEILFMALTLIRTAVYGIWTIKNRNVSGGIFIIFLCITSIALFVMTLITDYR